MKYRTAPVALIVSAVLTGCGTSAPGATAPSPLATVTSSAVSTESVAPTTGTIPAPKLTAAQAATAFKKGCEYYSYDLDAMTGELKESNLTAGELKEAARYVTGDLDGVEPHLGAAQGAQVAQAETVLATAETSTGPQGVPSRETDFLSERFGSALFSTLSKTVKAACRLAHR